MSLIGRIRAALRTTPAPESPRFELQPWGKLFGYIPRDLQLTIDQQLAVSAAWACVRNIVDPIAASELKIYEEVEGRRVEQREGWLYHLLNVEPHPQYTSQGWGEVMLTRAVAAGDAYAYIRPDGIGRTFSLQPLDPYRMSADDEGGEPFYLYDDPVKGRVPLAEREVLHIRGPRTGGFFGDSSFARAAGEIALAKAARDYATDYYANGALPGVMLKPPAAMAGPLTPAQRTGVRDAWKALFGGRKRGGVGSLDPGWEIQVIETDAEKSQVISAREAQVLEIARYFGVPGHLLGIRESAQGYGKNLAELSIGFVRQTLEPWARRVEEELRRKLMPERRGRGWWLEYDLSRLRKGDEESIARAEEIALRTGVLTINEARASRGLPGVKNGDVTLVGGKPLADVVKPPKPEPAPAPREGMDMDGEPPDDMDEREPKRRDAMAALDWHARAFKARRSPQHAERLRMATRRALRSVAPEVEARALDVAIASVEAGAEPGKAAETLVA